MKFKDYRPPEGGLQGLQRKLDELEVPSLHYWKIALPSLLVAALLAFAVLIPRHRQTDPEIAALMAFYSRKSDQWSTSDSFKEVPTGHSEVKFFWYEADGSRTN